jgi:RES domain-containing protein
MEFWRISNYLDLSGIGGVKASGRWHTRGRPVVYLADHPASAFLEMLVRLDDDLIPATYTLLRVVVSEDLPMTAVALRDLPPDWRDKPATTRQVGDRWLDQSSTATLRVPSAIVPVGQNLLLNPAHPAAGTVRVVEVIKAPFDPRLIKTPGTVP